MVAASRPSQSQENAALRGTWRRQASTYVLENTESPEVIAAPFAVFAEESVAPVPVEFSPHRHAHHELVWVRGGTMTVRQLDRMLTVPEGRGLWIPAGVEHSGRMTAHTKLCDAFFDVERSPVAFPGVTGIEMTPLLESLLTHLQDPGLGEAERLRAEAVAFDVLTPAAGEALSLAVPASRHIAPIVAALLADPADERGLSEWAEAVRTSERTVSRAFRQATGLSFVQ